MTEITFFVPAYTHRLWIKFVRESFGSYTEGPVVHGLWNGQWDSMQPWTVLSDRVVVPEVVAKIKELFGERAVYVRYGEAEVL